VRNVFGGIDVHDRARPETPTVTAEFDVTVASK
jgi:hypothetical protein